VTERICAIERCTEPPAAAPMMIDMAALPGPFVVDLCPGHREDFEAGVEAIERLVDGDAEALPIGGRLGRQLELEAGR
jgi:hypothetical protein